MHLERAQEMEIVIDKAISTPRYEYFKKEKKKKTIKKTGENGFRFV